jgi:hypothetical protein
MNLLPKAGAGWETYFTRREFPQRHIVGQRGVVGDAVRAVLCYSARTLK